MKEEPYIEAARLAGVGSLAIIFRHVLPNVLAPIIVQAALRVSGAIITESGAVVPRPRHPAADPGMGPDDRRGPDLHRHGLVETGFPGLAIMLLATGFSLLADGFAEKLGLRE